MTPSITTRISARPVGVSVRAVAATTPIAGDGTSMKTPILAADAAVTSAGSKAIATKSSAAVLHRAATTPAPLRARRRLESAARLADVRLCYPSERRSRRLHQLANLAQ